MAHQICYFIGLALNNTARASNVQRKSIAPFTRVDSNGRLFLTEESFLAEREENRSLVLRRMIKNVCVLIGLSRKTIENLERLLRTSKKIVINALRVGMDRISGWVWLGDRH